MSRSAAAGCRTTSGPPGSDSAGPAGDAAERGERPPRRSPELLPKAFGRQGTADEETLDLVAAVLLQELALSLGLDPFGDDAEVQAVGQVDRRGAERGVLRVELDAADEALVDLQDVDRKALEVGEGRVAGAEVVEGDLDAQLLQLGELREASLRRAPWRRSR